MTRKDTKAKRRLGKAARASAEATNSADIKPPPLHPDHIRLSDAVAASKGNTVFTRVSSKGSVPRPPAATETSTDEKNEPDDANASGDATEHERETDNDDDEDDEDVVDDDDTDKSSTRWNAMPTDHRSSGKVKAMRRRSNPVNTHSRPFSPPCDHVSILTEPMIKVSVALGRLFRLCFDRTLQSLYEISRPELRSTILKDTILKLSKQEATDRVTIWTDEDYSRFVVKTCTKELMDVAVHTSTNQVIDMLTDLAHRHGQDIANEAGPCACCFTKCLCCLQSLIDSINSQTFKQSVPLPEMALKASILSQFRSCDANLVEHVTDETMELYASFAATLTKHMANLDLFKQAEIMDVRKKLTEIQPLDLYYEALTREFCGDGDVPQNDDPDGELSRESFATSDSSVKALLESLGHTTLPRPCLREGQMIICQQYRRAKESLLQEYSQWHIDKSTSLTELDDDARPRVFVKYDNLGTLYRRAAARALCNRAIFDAQLGRFRLAADILKRAQSLDPIQTEYPTNLAALFIQLRMFPEALKQCEIGLRLVPQHPKLLFHRGVCRLAEGDTALSAEDFKDAIKLGTADKSFRKTLPPVQIDDSLTPAIAIEQLCQWAGQLTAPDLSTPLTKEESKVCNTSTPPSQFPRSQSEPISIFGREGNRGVAFLPVCEQELYPAYKEALAQAVKAAHCESQEQPLPTKDAADLMETLSLAKHSFARRAEASTLAEKARSSTMEPETSNEGSNIGGVDMTPATTVGPPTDHPSPDGTLDAGHAASTDPIMSRQDCIERLDGIMLALFFALHALGEQDPSVPPASKRGAKIRAKVYRAHVCKTACLTGAAVSNDEFGIRLSASHAVDANAREATASQDTQSDVPKEKNEASAWSASDSDDTCDTVMPFSSQTQRQGAKRLVKASGADHDGGMPTSSSSELLLDEGASRVSRQGSSSSTATPTGIKTSRGKKGKKMSSKAQGKQRQIDSPPKLHAPSDAHKEGTQSPGTSAPSTPPKANGGGPQMTQSGGSPSKMPGPSRLRSKFVVPAAAAAAAAAAPRTPPHSPRAEEIPLPPSSPPSSPGTECVGTDLPREAKTRARSSSGNVPDIFPKEGHHVGDANSGGLITGVEEPVHGLNGPKRFKFVRATRKM